MNIPKEAEEEAVATMTMNPMLPVAPPSTVAATAKPVETERSFAEYMEKKVADLREKQGQLKGKPARKDVAKTSKPAAGEDDGKVVASNGHAVLATLMAELRKLATDTAAGPGEWTVVVPDPALLTQLGQEAGLSEADLASLLQQWKIQGGKLTLDDLFAALGRSFEQLSTAKPISVPEPELPLLETLLARMGVAVEDVNRTANQSVTGDGNFDLELFQQGLQGLKAQQPVTLSAWETEQLRAMLQQAGASKGLLDSLLPLKSDLPANLSLDRLQALLANAISDIKAARAKADIPAFLTDLEKLLAQAGFEDKRVGWSPVVAGSVNAIHEELLKTVDFATVKVEKTVRPVAVDDTGKVLQEGDEIGQEMRAEKENAIDEWLASGRKIGAGSDSQPSDDGLGGRNPRPGDDREPAGILQPLTAADRKPLHAESGPDTGFAGKAPEIIDQTPAALNRSAAPPHLARWSATELQQQVFEQVNGGVMRGLRNNEHQMVLRLHPKELGEVKVNVLVRDDQVAVSFTAENAKVKAMLESSMDQFRDSMERQGFALDQFFVGVGQEQHERGEQWRLFEESWRQQRPQGKKETLAELPGDVLYRRVTDGYEHDGGISVFA